jgi:hypothetical protein
VGCSDAALDCVLLLLLLLQLAGTRRHPPATRPGLEGSAATPSPSTPQATGMHLTYGLQSSGRCALTAAGARSPDRRRRAQPRQSLACGGADK